MALATCRRFASTSGSTCPVPEANYPTTFDWGLATGNVGLNVMSLPSALRPFGEPDSEYPVGDLALAASCTLLLGFWGDMYVTYPMVWARVLVILSNLGLTVPLALRRTDPMLMLAIMAVSGTLQALLVHGPLPSIMVVPIAAYSFGRWVQRPRSRAVLAVGLYASVLAPLSWLAMTGPGTRLATLGLFMMMMGVCLSAVVVPYLLGRRVREQEEADRERTLTALQRYEIDLQRREEQAGMTEARLRNEIARELHDVVAHSLSVIIVQAQGGKALATKRPDQAIEVLDTIADTGRQALTEMRRIVGVLREGSPDPDYRPNPGLAEIPEMVARAGERVLLEVRGTAPQVPPSLALTVYRVVQEAVTNFLKHAGAQAICQVRLSYLPVEISIEVSDDGLGAGVSSDGRGQGLRGMRERVTSMGGQLSAGPAPDGGFLVRVSLPLFASGQSTQTGPNGPSEPFPHPPDAQPEQETS